MKKNSGFTLVELMIVLAIITLLATVALPAYNESVDKTRRSDGQSTLLQLTNAMERYYSEQSPFTYVGAALGAGGIFPDEAPLEGAAKYYDLSITAPTATTYTLLATPKGAQLGDGFMTINQAAQRAWDRNDNSAIDVDEACWSVDC